MTPAARRILAAAAAHRRQRATARWVAHHAEMSEDRAKAALKELAAEGLVTMEHWEDGAVYEIKDSAK